MAARALSLPSFSGSFFSFVRRPLVLYGFYTATLFLVFLFVTLPHEIVLRWLLEAVEPRKVATLNFDDAGPIWNGYAVEGLKVDALPFKENDPPLLESSQVRIHGLTQLALRLIWFAAPRVATRTPLDPVALVQSQPLKLPFSADLYGGTLDGYLSSTPGEPPTFSAHAEWSGVEVRRYRLLTTWLEQGRLAGTLSGWLEAQTSLGAAPAGEGEIFLQKAGLTGGKIMGITVPDLSIDDAKSKFKIEGDRLELQDTTLSGNDIGLQIKGFVTIRQPLGQSLLNLNLTIQKLPENLKPLVTVFAPRAKTLPAQLSISGPLGRLQVK